MGILTTYLTVSADKVNLSASIRYYRLFVAVFGEREGGHWAGQGGLGRLGDNRGRLNDSPSLSPFFLATRKELPTRVVDHWYTIDGMPPPRQQTIPEQKMATTDMTTQGSPQITRIGGIDLACSVKYMAYFSFRTPHNDTVEI